MEIGIIGLPQSGKTTVFNAVTRGHADTVPSGAGRSHVNVGVAKVPDPRLQVLSDMFHSKRIVPAEVQYVDIPGTAEGISKGIGGEHLDILQGSDAMLLVVRAFEDPAVPHVEESVEPYRDAATLELELTFSDLGILERRSERVRASLKGAKAAERSALRKEEEMLQGIRKSLEEEEPLRQQSLSPEARALANNYHLLTGKPLVVLFNTGEEAAAESQEVEEEMARRLGKPHLATAAFCGKLEMELAQMTEDEEEEFRASLGAGESGLERMVRLSYGAVDLVSFLTTGEDETRAWSVVRGTRAPQAAGKVHSDIERGFIRAEVVPFEELQRSGSMAEARRRGVLRAEGKQYVVRDGDVINFLFNV